jgi:PhnB protein
MKAVVPYLNFDGTTREVMTFYHECLGGTLDVQTFRESGMPSPPEAADRVVHARITSGSAVVMASDIMPGMPFRQGNNFAMIVECDSASEQDSFIAGLSKGGKITMEAQNTFWGARFAMLTDRYGINWMLNFELPKA